VTSIFYISDDSGAVTMPIDSKIADSVKTTILNSFYIYV